MRRGGAYRKAGGGRWKGGGGVDEVSRAMNGLREVNSGILWDCDWGVGGNKLGSVLGLYS